MLTPTRFSRRSWRWGWIIDFGHIVGSMGRMPWCLDANFDAFTPNFDVNVLLFTSREGPNRPTTPHIDILMTILIKMLTIKMMPMVTFSIRREKPMVCWLFLYTSVGQLLKMINLKRKTMTTIFSPKVKTNGFLMVLRWRWNCMTSSQNGHFQSEGKFPMFFQWFCSHHKICIDSGFQSEGKFQCFFDDFVGITRFASIPVFNRKGNYCRFLTISYF